MKYLLLALVLLVLAGCDSSSDINAARAQYQAASANLSAAIAQQAAIDKATVQAKMAATEAVMATQGAQDAAVKQLQIEASATMSAIDIKAQQDDLLNRQALATRIANDYNLQATQEWQSAQATSTAIALDVANKLAKNQRVQANADFWSSFLPDLARIIIAALIILIGILVWYVGRRAYHDDQKRKHETEHAKILSRFVTTSGGKFYLPEGEKIPVLQNQLPRTWEIPDIIDAEEVIEQNDPEPERPKSAVWSSTDIRGEAIKMIDDSIKTNGETEQLPGWRLIPGWTSEPWQDVKNYLVQFGLVYQRDDRKYYAVNGTLADVRYKLISTSPTPREGQENP